VFPFNVECLSATVLVPAGPFHHVGEAADSSVGWIFEGWDGTASLPGLIGRGSGGEISTIDGVKQCFRYLERNLDALINSNKQNTKVHVSKCPPRAPLGM
jgi:hypothetical protein